MTSNINLFWFRRDLRLDDNTGLYQALRAGLPVLPLFIFDRNILDELDDPADRRVVFIYETVDKIRQELEEMGAALLVVYGRPEDVFTELLKTYPVNAVYTNRDYEPYARERDDRIASVLAGQKVGFLDFKDQVIFEREEISKDDHTAYSVFTPYARRWKKEVSSAHFAPAPSRAALHRLLQQPPSPMPSLHEMGFSGTGEQFPARTIALPVIRRYEGTRNYPAIAGTTRLGVHLRYGTLSIRKLVSIAFEQHETFLNELIWREFFMQMLWRQPRLVTESCRPEYDEIAWRNNEGEFERWCNGTTGFPIVDGGMRELNETGFMHNRVRMITASFLVKHLLIDWRWGEAYFARKLLDYELASNIGNWQWVAGCGCDAAPYFRLFNPDMQAKKFDPEEAYIARWVPEYKTTAYPEPMVEHSFARERCLRMYKEALTRSRQKDQHRRG
jgi:deoxyribodipyrimidine photo-lyase